jgi:REP element-mobilizing transposase RayT
MREVIAQSFARIVRERGYTVWACAIMQDHSHLIVRTHKDRAVEMWHYFASAAAESLRSHSKISSDHPIWSHRPWRLLLFTRPRVIQSIGYVERNPAKHGLPNQKWEFVTPCPWVAF